MSGLCWQGRTFKPPQDSPRTLSGLHTDGATAPTATLANPPATKPTPTLAATAKQEAPSSQGPPRREADVFSLLHLNDTEVVNSKLSEQALNTPGAGRFRIRKANTGSASGNAAHQPPPSSASRYKDRP